MDDRVSCKDCQMMPKLKMDGEYHPRFGQCAAGNVWWHPEQKLRCELFRPINEIFWL